MVDAFTILVLTEEANKRSGTHSHLVEWSNWICFSREEKLQMKMIRVGSNSDHPDLSDRSPMPEPLGQHTSMTR